jgi:hypothetical protein
MRRLVVAGLLYLTGIAVILVIKPQYMFREDGRWKEFGIGRDPKNFTYIPFWLFAIIWAIVSYVLVVMIDDAFFGVSSYEDSSYHQEPVRPRNRSNNKRNTSANVELTPGYYMLNESSSGRNGVPRYVYLGPEEPVV